MTGKHTPAIIHGTVESILFARASSRAPALYGFRKMDAAGGAAGVPGWRLLVPSGVVICSSEGDR
jgi:hypothetical protein